MNLARLPFTDFWCFFGACLVLADLRTCNVFGVYTKMTVHVV
jgi:hypothetical protein